MKNKKTMKKILFILLIGCALMSCEKTEKITYKYEISGTGERYEVMYSDPVNGQNSMQSMSPWIYEFSVQKNAAPDYLTLMAKPTDNASSEVYICIYVNGEVIGKTMASNFHFAKIRINEIDDSGKYEVE